MVKAFRMVHASILSNICGLDIPLLQEFGQQLGYEPGIVGEGM